MADTRESNQFAVRMAVFARPISMSRTDTPVTEMFSEGTIKYKVADMLYTPHGLYLKQGDNTVVVPLDNVLYVRK